MNDYEMVVILHPDLEIDVEKPLKKVTGIIKDNGGKIVKEDNWGKRKLAYQINKQDHGVYVVYDVQIPAQSVAKVEQTLNITDEVIRYLIVKPAPVIEDDKKSKKEDDKEDKKEKSTKKAEKEEAKSTDSDDDKEE